MLKDLIRKLSRSRFSYDPLVRVELSKTKLLHNLNEFKKLAPLSSSGQAMIAPVLKSNAYGHGLVQIAKILDKESLPFIIVDSYFEAVALRTNGIQAPLLILGYTPLETMIRNKLKRITFTIISLETLKQLLQSLKKTSKQTKRPLQINLKIDTGMSRQGILLTEINEAIACISAERKIILAHISSHFADADSHDISFTEQQISAWNPLVDHFLHTFPNLSYYHISATNGHFFNKKVKANVSRLGIGLYGIESGGLIDSKVSLQPVLEVKTGISSIKHIKKDMHVGYGCTFKASRDMTIATLPLGYFEGIDRRLSSKGFVKIGDHFAPIIGRVSMNITTIDVTTIPDVRIETLVTVISSEAKDVNSIENNARLCETIPYEMLVHIAGHLQRVVI